MSKFKECEASTIITCPYCGTTKSNKDLSTGVVGDYNTCTGCNNVFITELNICYDGTEENGKAGWYSLPYEFLEWGVNKLTQEQKDRIMEID